ncbi:MAG: CBS domain-containing protein [Methanomassiliicoccaceae archaeon]|jgi:CBS domain-containing protein|nr:CBS domain-containing protein [Methanomassiliicoccaceae archaeon]
MAKLHVRDIMTTQVQTLKETDTIKQATVLFALHNISGAPVVDDDRHLIGILSETDILELVMRYQNQLNIDHPSLYMLESPMDDASGDVDIRKASDAISNTLVRDIMTRTVLTTTPDAQIADITKEMITKTVNRVPVLEKGILVGIISRGDIIFSIYKRKRSR